MGVWTNHIKANGKLIGTRRETDETQRRQRETERERERGGGVRPERKEALGRKRRRKIISGTSATNQQLPNQQLPTTQYPVPSDQRRGTMNHVATTRSTSVTVGTRTNYTRYARGRANTNTNTNTTTMKYNNNNNKTPRIAKNATALAAGVTVLGTTLVAQVTKTPHTHKTQTHTALLSKQKKLIPFFLFSSFCVLCLECTRCQ